MCRGLARDGEQIQGHLQGNLELFVAAAKFVEFLNWMPGIGLTTLAILQRGHHHRLMPNIDTLEPCVAAGAR